MSNPLSMFRKHQFALMVVLVFVAMGAFVIAPSIDEYLRARSSGGPQVDPVVVSYNGGNIKESELQRVRQAHNLLVFYLRTLVQEARQRNGNPRGVRMNPIGQVVDPGIPSDESNENLAYTRLLAEKAEQMGMVVNDEALIEFLQQITGGVVPTREFGVIFKEVLGERVTEEFILDRLRTELLAQKVRTLMLSGLYVTPRGAVTPGKAWDYFQRLNRRVTAEFIPIPVASLYDELKGEPSEAELRAIYEEGKNRLHLPDQPEPGFRRRREAAFHYAKAEFQKFLEEEKANIIDTVTDEEIETRYNENPQNYPIVDSPAAEDADEMTEQEPATGDRAPDADDATSSDAASEDAAASDADSVDSVTKEAQNAENHEKKEPADSEKTEPTDDDANAAAEPQEEPAVNESSSEPEAAETPAVPSQDVPSATDPSSDSQGRKDSSAALVFVQARQENSPDAETTDTGETPPASEGAEEVPEAEAANPETEPSQPADEPPPANEPNSNSTPSVPNATDSPNADGSTADAESADSESADAEAAEEAPAVRPLDDALRAEIREEIADEKARRQAQVRIDEAIAQVRKQVEQYARALRRSQFQESASQSVAKGFQLDTVEHDELLTLAEVPLVNALTVESYELGEASQTQFTSWPPQTMQFEDVAFQEGLPPYAPLQMNGETSEVTFLFWKTDEVDGFVPTFEEAREEVVDAWNREQGLELAKRKAEQLVDEAKKAESLTMFAEGRDELSVILPNAFSWMSTGFNPGGMGAPTLSYVEGLEGIGPDLMQSIFSFGVGEVGVAVNQPRTVVYVVRIMSQAPPVDQLREQFLRGGVTFEVENLANTANAERQRAWYEDLDEEMGVVWNQDAAAGDTSET